MSSTQVFVGELMYIDYPVIMADLLDVCIARLKAWKAAVETKGLRVNVKKTKLFISDFELDFGEFPCAFGRGSR